MILLDYNNKIIFETITRVLTHSEGKRDLLDITLADFDGVSFHISTPDPEQRNIVRVSVQWPCIPDLLEHGGRADVAQIYGSMLDAEPEPGYDLSVTLDANNPQEPDKLPLKISFLKRHLLAAPFKKLMGAVYNKKNPTEVIYIKYRSQTEEAVWIKPSSDSVTIVYSIRFADKSDKILAKVFLTELEGLRRTMTSVPAVRYSIAEPPLELQGQREVPEGDDVGFVTIVLFEQHLQPKSMFKTINLVQTFRDYLHYHIKCSKAYMHTRMRERVTTWLQVLNRARPEPFEKKEKKLASGRTFKRK